MPPLEHRVALEVPDFPMFWAYEQWLRQWPPSEGYARIMITARVQWADRRDQLNETMNSLLYMGCPSLNWIHVTSTKPIER